MVSVLRRREETTLPIVVQASRLPDRKEQARRLHHKQGTVKHILSRTLSVGERHERNWKLGLNAVWILLRGRSRVRDPHPGPLPREREPDYLTPALSRGKAIRNFFFAQHEPSQPRSDMRGRRNYCRNFFLAQQERSRGTRSVLALNDGFYQAHRGGGLTSSINVPMLSEPPRSLPEP